MTFKRDLFSAMLRFHIDSRHLNMREAAEASGVSLSTVSRITRGEAPDLDSFAKLAVWMGTDANGYIGLDEPQEAYVSDWLRLHMALLDLGVPSDLAGAFVQVVRLIKEQNRVS